MFVADLRGSYSGVMGLPLFETAAAAARGGRAAAGVTRAAADADGHRDPHQREHCTRRAPRWSRTACCRRCFSSAPAAAASSATSTRAGCRACCRACRRPSSRSAWSAPRSCTPRTSSIARHEAWGIEAPRTENIRALVAEGNEILVQVVKDPLGTKGARLTTYITLPSRYLVYMPQGRGVGVSARIENEAERERLRSAVLAGLEPDEDAGYIVRTAAEDAPPEALRADMMYLRKLWEFVRQKGLRTEPGSSCTPILPLHLRILRDLLRPGRRAGADRSAERASRDARVRRDLHARCAAAHRAVRRAAPDIRAAPRRGGDPEGARSQGLR